MNKTLPVRIKSALVRKLRSESIKTGIPQTRIAEEAVAAFLAKKGKTTK